MITYNAVGEYDPLRSISLFLSDGCGGQRLFDIRASSAWTAQLWVDGLTSAYYVYRCMIEQYCAGENLINCFSSVHAKYVVQPCHSKSLLSMPCSKQATRQSLSTSGSHSNNDHELSPTQRHFQSGYYSERSLTSPSSCKVGGSSSPHSVRLSMESRLAESPPGGTPGLPYIHSFLSSICCCHAYEIMPSRSIDVRYYEVERKPTGKSCCRQCRNACKIALDLDNL